MPGKRGGAKAGRGGKRAATRPEITPTVSATTAAEVHSSSSESEEGEINLGVSTVVAVGSASS